MAIASPHSAHIGTDSAAFLHKASLLHQLINQDKKPKKPWALQTDGDLWKIYRQHAKAKGVNSIKLSKVKGHATDEMVASKHVKQRDREGSDKADELADEAISFFGKQLPELGKRYAERQDSYTHLVANIQCHLVKMYKTRAACRTETGALAPHISIRSTLCVSSGPPSRPTRPRSALSPPVPSCPCRSWRCSRIFSLSGPRSSSRGVRGPTARPQC